MHSTCPLQNILGWRPQRHAGSKCSYRLISVISVGARPASGFSICWLRFESRTCHIVKASDSLNVYCKGVLCRAGKCLHRGKTQHTTLLGSCATSRFAFYVAALGKVLSGRTSKSCFLDFHLVLFRHRWPFHSVRVRELKRAVSKGMEPNAQGNGSLRQLAAAQQFAKAAICPPPDQ